MTQGHTNQKQHRPKLLLVLPRLPWSPWGTDCVGSQTPAHGPASLMRAVLGSASDAKRGLFLLIPGLSYSGAWNELPNPGRSTHALGMFWKCMCFSLFQTCSVRNTELSSLIRTSASPLGDSGRRSSLQTADTSSSPGQGSGQSQPRLLLDRPATELLS